MNHGLGGRWEIVALAFAQHSVGISSWADEYTLQLDSKSEVGHVCVDVSSGAFSEGAYLDKVLLEIGILNRDAAEVNMLC